MWEALGDEEKAVYKKRNEEDRLRYQREMEAYKAGVPIATPLEDDNTVENEEAKEVFSSTTATTQISSHVSKGLQAHEAEKTENMCIKRGCSKVAIKSSEWDDEYCSNDCAVGHCQDVFALYVAEQSSAAA